MPEPAKAVKLPRPVGRRRGDVERRFGAKLGQLPGEAEMAVIDLGGEARVGGAELLRGEKQLLGLAAGIADGCHAGEHQAPKRARPAKMHVLSKLTALSSRRAWTASSAAMSLADLRYWISGCRLMVPVEEHGASSRMASKRSFGCHVLASACTVSAASPRRFRFSARRPSRVVELSTATTEAPASTSCAVLPPGAAHRSATRLPEISPRSCAGSEAAASCTHH